MGPEPPAPDRRRVRGRPWREPAAAAHDRHRVPAAQRRGRGARDRRDGDRHPAGPASIEQTRLMEEIVYAAVPETVASVVSVGASGWRPDQASQGEIRLSLVPASRRKRSNVEIADGPAAAAGRPNPGHGHPYLRAPGAVPAGAAPERRRPGADHRDPRLRSGDPRTP